jgi:hypothetical protein
MCCHPITHILCANNTLLGYISYVVGIVFKKPMLLGLLSRNLQAGKIQPHRIQFLDDFRLILKSRPTRFYRILPIFNEYHQFLWTSSCQESQKLFLDLKWRDLPSVCLLLLGWYHHLLHNNNIIHSVGTACCYKKVIDVNLSLKRQIIFQNPGATQRFSSLWVLLKK